MFGFKSRVDSFRKSVEKGNNYAKRETRSACNHKVKNASKPLAIKIKSDGSLA